MRKSWLVLILVLAVILIMQGVLAISTDLRESYRPSETIIVEISGNILGIVEGEDIDFRRGHVSVPLEFGVKKLGGRWFLWAIAPESENNYTLVINNVETTVNGKTTELDFEQNFSVQGDLIEYNVKPGLVFSKEDFDLSVFLNEDFDRPISVSFPVEREVVLKPGANEIDFSTSGMEGARFVSIVVGDYQIPAYLINVEESVEIALPDLRFRPRRIVSTVLLSEDVPNYPFFLVNLEDRERELSFEFNKELFLLEPDLGGIVLGAGEIAEFNLSIVQGVDKEIDEIFLARSLGDDFSLEFPISINFTSKIEDVGTPYLEGDERENLGSYCSELGGIPCTGGEVCSVEEVSSLDGGCCIGVCSASASGSGSKVYIGWLLAGIVLIAVLIVWARYKKAKMKQGGLKERVKSVEKKMGKELP